MKVRNIGKYTLDLLFPPRCAWCGKVIGFTECDGCGALLEPLRLPAGQVTVSPQTSGYLQQAWACYRYESPVSDAIVRFKLQDEPQHFRELGRRLAARYQSEKLGGRFDLIVPVPVSPKTQRARGYNQSALLAGALSQWVGLPCDAGLLHKVKETRRQMDLERRERLANVLGAYGVAVPARAAGRRVLLVDDVLTTGATLNECAKTLLDAGAAACGALCVASA